MYFFMEVMDIEDSEEYMKNFSHCIFISDDKWYDEDEMHELVFHKEVL